MQNDRTNHTLRMLLISSKIFIFREDTDEKLPITEKVCTVFKNSFLENVMTDIEHLTRKTLVKVSEISKIQNFSCKIRFLKTVQTFSVMGSFPSVSSRKIHIFDEIKTYGSCGCFASKIINKY